MGWLGNARGTSSNSMEDRCVVPVSAQCPSANALFCMVLFDLVWFGLEFFGFLWFGLVWLYSIVGLWPFAWDLFLWPLDLVECPLYMYLSLTLFFALSSTVSVCLWLACPLSRSRSLPVPFSPLSPSSSFSVSPFLSHSVSLSPSPPRTRHGAAINATPVCCRTAGNAGTAWICPSMEGRGHTSSLARRASVPGWSTTGEEEC